MMRRDEWANFVLNSHAIVNSKFADNFLKYVIISIPHLQESLQILVVLRGCLRKQPVWKTSFASSVN